MTATRAIFQNRASRRFVLFAIVAFVALQFVLHLVYGVGIPMRWQQGAFFLAAIVSLGVVLMLGRRRRVVDRVRGFDVVARPNVNG